MRDGDGGNEIHQPGEVRHIALDYTRAREQLGYEPQVGLRDGLERTLQSVSSSTQA